MLTGLIIASLAAYPGPGGPGGFGFGLLLLVLIPLFFLGLFILFASIGRRKWMHRWASQPSGAESTLAERFAQGDIDEKEYRARLEVLKATSGRVDRP